MTTTTKTFNWNDINWVLWLHHTGTARIAAVMFNLARGKEEWTWSEVNDALVAANFHASKIVNLLKEFNKIV